MGGLNSWILIGTFAVLLVLAVVIAARLRWIQTRPIRACIVLSVFAHLLLLAVIYVSKALDLPFIPGGDDSVLVQVCLEDFASPTPSDELVVESPPLEVEETFVEDLQIEPEVEPAAPEELPMVSELTEESLPDDKAPDDSNNPDDEPLVDNHEDIASQLVTDAAESPVPVGDTPPALPLLPRSAEVVPLAPAPLQPLVVDQPPLSPIARPAIAEAVGEPETDVAESDSDTDSFLESRKFSTQLTVTPATPDVSVPSPYRERLQRPADAELERRGGGRRCEAAVESALAWLSRAQSSDGRWDAASTGAGQGGWIERQHRGTTGLRADTGITGLALLAFLGAGHTSDHGSYRDTVQAATDYLRRQQSANGCLGGPASVYARMYCHGIATLAICEAVAMTSDSELRQAAQQAIDYTFATQHSQTGGWRYSPGDRGDMSQFGWQLMSINAARAAGLDIPSDANQRLERFLRIVRSGSVGGLAGYRPGHAPSPSMTAEALACRLFLGQRSGTAEAEATGFIMTRKPGRGQRNLYFWYYGTLALRQLENDAWKEWNRSLQRQLLPTQRRHGGMAGSWDPNTVWGKCGGRVYSTALATLCLESYYRYPRVRSDYETNSDAIADGWSGADRR